ncbi:MAG: flavodoxin domain-containing protein [Chlamydiales bacterium]
MSTILIVYATDWGSTKKMAEAVASGAKSVKDTTVVLKAAEDAKKEDVLSADALVMGSPVHMGSADWRVKQFIDKICSKLWMEDKMVGKVGAVFASGGGFGNAGGGCEITLLGLLNNLVELGLIIIPLPKNTPGYAKGGIQWGPYGRSMGENMEQTGLPDERTEAAHHHGVHIAKATALLKSQNIFS